jgi:ribosomal protein S12 methylthiotransferase accessory factor
VKRSHARRAAKPTLRPDYRYAVLPREGVVLLSPRGDAHLEGALYERLVPRLDGERSIDAIVAALGTTHDPAEVYYAMARLERGGFVVQKNGRTPGSRLRAQPRDGPRRELAVDFVTVGMERAEAFRALRAYGWKLRRGSRLSLVMADDVLAPELQRVAARHARDGVPWLLVVPAAPSVGPLFMPRETACYTCFAQRVSRNRALETYLRSRGCVPRHASARLTLFSAPLHRVMRQVQRVVALRRSDARRAQLFTWNGKRGKWQAHVVQRRPQCSSCGHAKQGPPAAGALTAKPTRHLVDPVTGVVTALIRHPVPELPPLHICIAATGSARGRQRLTDVLRDLRHQPSGRGASAAEAQMSALGEAIERYSGVWQGDEPHMQATFASLEAKAIHPDSVLHFSPAQQRARRKHNASAPPSARVPAAFDTAARIQWTPIWSLTHNEERWLPTSLLYYGHPEAFTPGFCYADSNGCAAGATREDALASALLELIERDAVAMWWYNRVRPPPVNVESLADPWCRAMISAFERAGRDMWALDLTNDLGIPVVAALSRRLTGASEAIVLGFGAHPDMRIALKRAIGEMGQMFAATATFERTDALVEPEVMTWLTRATIQRHTYLTPIGSPRSLREPAGQTTPQTQLTVLLDVLHARGFQVLFLDQTRPDIGVPVVRAIVPGLRHFWPRLGDGRLYHVPVSLGWLERPRSESELNPIAFFL